MQKLSNTIPKLISRCEIFKFCSYNFVFRAEIFATFGSRVNKNYRLYHSTCYVYFSKNKEGHHESKGMNRPLQYSYTGTLKQSFKIHKDFKCIVILTFIYSMYRINKLDVLNTVHMRTLFKTHCISFGFFAFYLQSIVQVIVFCQLVKMLYKTIEKII
jgi:hypothetical protein